MPRLPETGACGRRKGEFRCKKLVANGKALLTAPLEENKARAAFAPLGPRRAVMAKETKAAAKPAAEKKVNPALMKPMTPSKELAAVVGTKPLPRTEVVSKMWEYIKKHKLQNPKNGREILADANLKKVFGVDKVTMFEMNKYISKHLS